MNPTVDALFQSISEKLTIVETNITENNLEPIYELETIVRSLCDMVHDIDPLERSKFKDPLEAILTRVGHLEKIIVEAQNKQNPSPTLQNVAANAYQKASK